MTIQIRLYYHLKHKAGVDQVRLDLVEGMTVADLKTILIKQYPALHSHLENILVLMDQKIVLDGDLLNDNSEIAFMTPVGGG